MWVVDRHTKAAQHLGHEGNASERLSEIPLGPIRRRFVGAPHMSMQSRGPVGTAERRVRWHTHEGRNEPVEVHRIFSYWMSFRMSWI